MAQFDGLDKLAANAGKKFALVFTLLIYLSIGPGLGIPRAASVPFEMAVAPYLPQGANTRLCMVIYSLVFFVIAFWLCLNPGKLVERIGHFLTPSLLTLLRVLFFTFLFKGNVDIARPQAAYAGAPFLKGFSEGYQTMDTIAALNFGLVIATTLRSFGINNENDLIKHTVYAGAVCRQYSCHGIYDALLYGYVQFKCVRNSGQRGMDTAQYRLSALRPCGGISAGGYIFPLPV